MDPANKPALYVQIYESAEIATASYMADLVFSAGIATLGMVLNSPAVVIGAMLISPLMGPILAAGLAFAASDIYLGVKSFLGIIGSTLGAVAFSAILVWQLPFQNPTAEVLTRTQPNLLDLGVAVFSGLAGSVVVARASNGGMGAALPGVAIAVALMPPLCAIGFGVGIGWNWEIISGAGLLFLTNTVAITGSAFLVFYLVGMEAAEVRTAVSEAAKRRATGKRLYSFLHDNAVLSKTLGEAGQLRWRIVMMAVTFLVLFIPLRSSLLQLRDETMSRAAAREAVRSLLPADQVLSQQLEILPESLIQRLVTTSAVDKDRIAGAEVELARRTGKSATIQVRQVANEEELALLRERLRAPAPPPPPPPPPNMTSLGNSVAALAAGPIHAVWPSESADLEGYEVGFTGEEMVVRLRYYAPRALEDVTAEALRNALRSTWKVENLRIELDRRGPKRPAPPVVRE